MKKNFRVKITETLTKEIYVKADNVKNAEDIIRDKYYNGDIILDSEDYDNNVEFEVEDIDPRNMSYLMYKGFSPIDAYYISEMFSTLKRLNITDYDDYIEEITDCAEDLKYIGKYDEKYFNTYVKNKNLCNYEFSDLESGFYDKIYKFYKTIDDKYIMKFQI